MAFFAQLDLPFSSKHFGPTGHAMPMYEYQCDGCNDVFEFIQKFSDPPMTECEACGGGLKKVLSAPSFHLTGGGWYADGYADAKPKEKKTTGGNDKKSSGGGAEKATKSKSDKGSGPAKKSSGSD